jgi:hypothetical protein
VRVLVSLPYLIPVFSVMDYLKLIPSSAANGGKVLRVVVAEGHCLAVNSLHRGMAQATSRWALIALSRVLTWVSTYGICVGLSGEYNQFSYYLCFVKAK